MDKKFTCEVCGKSCTRKGDLTVHLRVHTNERPFSCEVCGAAFKQKGTLNRHIRTHTNQRPFSCDVCGKSYTRKEHLNRHLFRIHGASSNKSSDRTVSTPSSAPSSKPANAFDFGDEGGDSLFGDQSDDDLFSSSKTKRTTSKKFDFNAAGDADDDLFGVASTASKKTPAKKFGQALPGLAGKKSIEAVLEADRDSKQSVGKGERGHTLFDGNEEVKESMAAEKDFIETRQLQNLRAEKRSKKRIKKDPPKHDQAVQTEPVRVNKAVQTEPVRVNKAVQTEPVRVNKAVQTSLPLMEFRAPQRTTGAHSTVLPSPTLSTEGMNSNGADEHSDSQSVSDGNIAKRFLVTESDSCAEDFDSIIIPSTPDVLMPSTPEEDIMTCNLESTSSMVKFLEETKSLGIQTLNVEETVINESLDDSNDTTQDLMACRGSFCEDMECHTDELEQNYRRSDSEAASRLTTGIVPRFIQDNRNYLLDPSLNARHLEVLEDSTEELNVAAYMESPSVDTQINKTARGESQRSSCSTSSKVFPTTDFQNRFPTTSEDLKRLEALMQEKGITDETDLTLMNSELSVKTGPPSATQSMISFLQHELNCAIEDAAESVDTTAKDRRAIHNKVVENSPPQLNSATPLVKV